METTAADQPFGGEQPRPRFSRARPSAHDDEPVTNERFEHAMGMLLDRVDQIQAEQAATIAAAIREVVTDRATLRDVVDGVAEVAQEHATRAAGRGVWWLLRNVVARWVVIAALVFGVAKVLGWDVAARIGAWLAKATGA